MDIHFNKTTNTTAYQKATFFFLQKAISALSCRLSCLSCCLVMVDCVLTLRRFWTSP